MSLLIQRAFVSRLAPTAEQKPLMVRTAGTNRFVWNKGLAINLERLENEQKLLSYVDLHHLSVSWKKTDELSFIGEAPSQTIQQTLKNLERSFKDAFDKNQPNKRLPRFKRKGKSRDSFTLPQGVKVDEKNNQIYLPKIGWVRFRNSRELFGKIKNTTVYRDGDHWYASIQVEYSIPKPQHPSLSMIALDMGVKRFFAQSDGSYQNPIDRIVKIADRIAYLQRGLARKIKGSANWRKQQKRIAKLHRRIANIRKDTLHKLSTELSKNHAVIVVEDLQIGNMTVRAKGKNVKAKSGLNRAILSQGWGLFLAMLDYKLRWQGGHLLRVNPAYTSQTCPVCDHVSRKNRPSQDEFCCQQCNYSGHADQVAAINVLARGHRAIVCGEWVQLGLSIKQKPVKSENGQPYKQLTLTATH